MNRIDARKTIIDYLHDIAQENINLIKEIPCIIQKEQEGYSVIAPPIPMMHKNVLGQLLYESFKTSSNVGMENNLLPIVIILEDFVITELEEKGFYVFHPYKQSFIKLKSVDVNVQNKKIEQIKQENNIQSHLLIGYTTWGEEIHSLSEEVTDDFSIMTDQLREMLKLHGELDDYCHISSDKLFDSIQIHDSNINPIYMVQWILKNTLS
ncbi:hypothetical protein [Chengkuizengella axinellae]|uniref:Uncharacterized protein n=1 Tax=Chengkuizengella axinellae TaxID=3064388 RepID=A0ABT9IZU7_9BACL|nr:hypothetical protein [Chengkuizengella sp. 2205SS18-9]MDP5274850.1 hypothetical protein [Chengkuizengella sp. 2205SS18-9]